MKTTQKLLLGLLAVVAMAAATPAQAYDHHGRYRHHDGGYRHAYYYHNGYYGYDYAGGFYPYYGGPRPYYWGPYSGPAVVVAPVHRHRFFFMF